MSAPDTIEIDCRDVVRLMMQFCAENGLHRSLTALHEDTGVPLDAVPSIEDLRRDIVEGRWALVLTHLNFIALPAPLLFDLYEHITSELASSGDIEVARRLLYDTEILQSMRSTDFPRYTKLEGRVQAAWAGHPLPIAQTTRVALADALLNDLSVVPSARLLSLLSDALKFQQSQGTIRSHVARFNIFNATAVTSDHFVERPCVTTRGEPSKMAQRSGPECICFSRNGRHAVTGSIDGFVEVWEATSGQLRMDLPYQAQDMFMKHDAAVLCLDVHRDSDVLVAGSHDGAIKTWRIGTGQCTRRYDKAHSQGVTSVRLNDDATAVLSASYDGGIRIHSLLHTQMLADIRHRACVNDVVFGPDVVLSGSSDGTLIVWGMPEGREVRRVAVPSATGATVPPCSVISVSLMTNSTYLVASRTSCAYAIDAANGRTTTVFNLPDKGLVVRAATVSSRGAHVVLAASDGSVHTFDARTGDHIGYVAIEGLAVGVDVVGIASSPRQCLTVVALSDGTLRWLVP